MSKPQMSWGKYRGMWLDQVHDDAEMTGNDLRVMYAITRFMGAKCLKPNPGNVILAQTAHVNEKTVRRALEKAVARGHLNIQEPNNRGHTRVLIAVLKSRLSSGQNVHTTSGHSGKSSGHSSGHCERGSPVKSNTCAILSELSELSKIRSR